MNARRIAPSQVKLIAVARRRLGLDDADYRAILRRVAGVGSSRSLDQRGFAALMAELHRLGFRSTSARKPFGERPGMASAGEIAKLRHLWREFTSGAGDDASLALWLERQGWGSHLRFLSHVNGQAAIGALSAMVARRRAGAPPSAA